MVKDGIYLSGRYQVLSKIGAGGMADVYKAKDCMLNRYVAVKVLKKEYREDENFVKKFRSEAQAAAGLLNPNIVNVYDVGEDRGLYYMVMELVEGITLKEYVHKKGKLSSKEAISIAIQMCTGIEAAHNHHIIHRDIKPANIFISEFGEYKLGDFGISKQLEHTMAGSTRAGTESYMAPEVFYGKRYDGTVDIYSLGIVLYQLANKGKLPFVSQDREIVSYSEVIKAKQKRLNGEPLPDPAVGGRALGDILRKACAFDPRDRYQNPQEMFRELKKLQQGYDEAEENEEILMEDIHFFSEADDSSTRLEKKDPEVSKLPKKLILAAGVICIAGIIAVLTWGYLHRDVSREADVDITLETVTPTTEIKISPTESATPTQAEVLPTETVSEDTGDIEESGDGDWFNDWNYDEEGNKIN